ncbi:MAG: hypothetical protein JNM44_08660 [Chitinophagaceae bacterium]|nr:hypothetical protein [Chitinophagaceae bacterium]
MPYTLETREKFDILKPEADFNFNELSRLAEEIRQNGKSLIMDLSVINQLTNLHLDALVQVHNEFYQNDLSFALCELQEPLKPIWQSHTETDTLNLTPTLIEAIDLVSMEGLEREFLREDFPEDL